MRSRCTRILGSTLVAIVGLALAAAPARAEEPAHLEWAEYLVATLTPADNFYGEPALIHWKGEGGLESSENRTKCAPLLTRLLEKAYDPDFVGWLGCTSPNAAAYHDAIEVEHGFTLIESIADVQPGDIIAIRYLDAGCSNLTCGGASGCSTTGHVAIVAAAPTARASTSPFVKGTAQYSVKVIDSSATYHGIYDTRYKADKYGAHDRGAGKGTMRLYVDTSDPELPVVGYTWSTSPASTYYSYSVRDLVIGRYQG
jgi:hypothetical protein